MINMIKVHLSAWKPCFWFKKMRDAINGGEATDDLKKEGENASDVPQTSTQNLQ